MRSFLTKHYRQLFMVSMFFFALTLLSACGLPQWLTTAQQILPIAVQMALGIITLIGALSGKTLDTSVAANLTKVVNAIQSGLQDVQAMVQEYQSNASPTLLGSIQAGVKAVIDNIDQFLNDTLGSVTDQATRDKIKAVLQLIQTELAAWASTLPLLTAKAGQQVSVTVPLSSKEFKAAYNKVIETMTGSPQVDAALSKLHPL